MFKVFLNRKLTAVTVSTLLTHLNVSATVMATSATKCERNEATQYDRPWLIDAFISSCLPCASRWLVVRWLRWEDWGLSSPKSRKAVWRMWLVTCEQVGTSTVECFIQMIQKWNEMCWHLDDNSIVDIDRYSSFKQGALMGLHHKSFVILPHFPFVENAAFKWVLNWNSNNIVCTVWGKYKLNRSQPQCIFTVKFNSFGSLLH